MTKAIPRTSNGSIFSFTGILESGKYRIFYTNGDWHRNNSYYNTEHGEHQGIGYDRFWQLVYKYYRDNGPEDCVKEAMAMILAGQDSKDNI